MPNAGAYGVGADVCAPANELLSKIARLSKAVLATTGGNAGDPRADVEDLRTVVERIDMYAESGIHATASMLDVRHGEPVETTISSPPSPHAKSAAGALFQEFAGMVGSLVEALDELPAVNEHWRIQSATALARQLGLMADLAATALGELPGVSDDAAAWMPAGALEAVIREGEGRAAA